MEASLWRRLPAPSASSGPRLTVQDLWHRYPAMAPEGWTLQGLSLELGQGELVGLLGPSGCGKTTLLRLIAGFETPARGTICLDGQEVAGGHRWVQPESRGVGMVFQDYALFPHLDAWQNACFGLTPPRRGQPASAQLRDRVAWLLTLMGLGGLERRYPHELSGGQRQRLALVRALAPGPSLVLLDEPFSNLDVEVRLRLRSELPEVLNRCGASGLLITHDPEEAMAICDRVAVMQSGVLHQCGAPPDLLNHPATAFVGRFVLQANTLSAHLDGSVVRTDVGPMHLLESSSAPPPSAGEGWDVLIPPEGLTFVPDPEGEAWVLGREFLGHDWAYLVQWGERRLRLRLPLEVLHSRGQRGQVGLQPDGLGWLFPGGQRLGAMAPAGRA
ncbi:MAG: ABC transporter ATP-binding protein [Cyanobacteriota bacterium]|nr:ABC transporter ATP-binding protein [Cyanobacteriota bacterium]